MNSYKKGDIVNYKGLKTIVTSLNPNGTITLNYASGSGKSGFAGTIPAIKSDYARTSFTNLIMENEEAELEEGVVTLASYNAAIDATEEATLNGYSRGRSDMAQKMRIQIRKDLAETKDPHLQWISDRLTEIEESEYVTEGGEVSPYKTVNLTTAMMKPYNSGHGIGMRDLRAQVETMVQEYVTHNPEAKKSMDNFLTQTAAEKKAEPAKKRTSDSDKTPEDFLRLARYMYKETIATPGEPRRYAGYKRYLSKVMHHYGMTEAQAYELVTGNLSNEKGKDPSPIQ